MKGVSAVVAVVLILMITVAIGAMAYLWSTGIFTIASEESTKEVEETIEDISGTPHLAIDNYDANKIYIRNDGNAILSDFSLFIDDELITSVAPDTLGVGDTGVVLYSPYVKGGKDKSKIKIISKEGASALDYEYLDGFCSDDSIVLCMSFEEEDGTFKDDSTYGNDGTWHDNSVAQGYYGVTGKIGKGILANGSSNEFHHDGDYVMINKDESLLPQTVSAFVWAKLGEDESGNILGRHKYVSPNWVGGYRIFYQGVVYVYIGETDNSPQLSITCGDLKTDEWTHIGFIYDGDRLTCYNNGEIANSTVASGKIVYDSGAHGIIVGAANTGGMGNRFPAFSYIDEVFIGNRAFTDEEIQLLYESGLE